ncbi:hypothetical protein CEXT_814191 [Caerostris extrusa]|uniref:Uncharacterized protein n=1 Tax=Caerostris extrusa TaxID=172846 RepID=A0AAV4SQV0_CAEEX|nr:hypothetical protein CEXT_814191 [Caerostris extrusa]
MQGDERNPKKHPWGNFRPPLPLNRRALRSNINFIRQDKSVVSFLMNGLDTASHLPSLKVVNLGEDGKWKAIRNSLLVMNH